MRWMLWGEAEEAEDADEDEDEDADADEARLDERGAFDVIRIDLLCFDS